MKSLKLTVVIILIIVVLVLVIPLFLPGSVKVSGDKCMKAPVELVFNQVNVLKNWKKWSPFISDTTMKISYEGAESGVGAKYSWAGDKVGNGKLEIVKSEQNEYIETKLDFGPQGTAGGEWRFITKEDSTCVSWTINIYDLQYPFGRWLGLMMKSGMKPVIDKALTKMKNIVEENNSPEINQKDN
jgi:hypothetical protein